MIPGFEGLTYYQILDISPGVDAKEIQDGYYRIREAFGKNSLASYSLYSQEEREQISLLLEEAYHTLIDPNARREYDQILSWNRQKEERAERLMQEQLPFGDDISRERQPALDFGAGEEEEIESRMAEGDEEEVETDDDLKEGPEPAHKEDERGPRLPLLELEDANLDKSDEPGREKERSSEEAENEEPKSPEDTASDEDFDEELEDVQPPEPRSSLERIIIREGAKQSRPIIRPPEYSEEATFKYDSMESEEYPEKSGDGPSCSPRDKDETGAGREVFEETIYDVPMVKNPACPLDYIEMGIPGKFLKEAREKRGLTIESVWETTRIRRPILKAIETEDYANLPADVFLKGMLLIYARFLQIEGPEEVVKGYMARLVAARDWMD